MSRLAPLYALRAFEAAARHLSFTRAAQELAITQSAVSRHVRTLEADFGCRLFERAGRGLRLTESGRLLLPGLQQGFSALQAACASLRSDEGALRMKAPSTLTMRWLMARLSRFRLQQPDIEIQLTAAEFRLLRYFMLHPEQILSKSHLAEHLYDGETERDSNVLEVHVNHLRRKLGRSVIETRRGQGYRFGASPA